MCGRFKSMGAQQPIVQGMVGLFSPRERMENGNPRISSMPIMRPWLMAMPQARERIDTQFAGGGSQLPDLFTKRLPPQDGGMM